MKTIGGKLPNYANLFDELQKLGKKAVLRFAYERDFMGRAAVGPTGEQILEHLDQLKPFLEKIKT